jgi:alkanesulfonate monooxygenase SsuD/methylene tetrahydromethanopterin reductase-like flavin-dependent oxidoreductase (luciferase family)
MPDL